jgi:hypothetical protein
MLWFAATVILGLLALLFIVNGLRAALIDEMLVGAVLAIGAYFTAVQAGLIQPVV